MTENTADSPSAQFQQSKGALEIALKVLALATPIGLTAAVGHEAGYYMALGLPNYFSFLAVLPIPATELAKVAVGILVTLALGVALVLLLAGATAQIGRIGSRIGTILAANNGSSQGRRSFFFESLQSTIRVSSGLASKIALPLARLRRPSRWIPPAGLALFISFGFLVVVPIADIISDWGSIAGPYFQTFYFFVVFVIGFNLLASMLAWFFRTEVWQHWHAPRWTNYATTVVALTVLAFSGGYRNGVAIILPQTQATSAAPKILTIRVPPDCPYTENLTLLRSYSTGSLLLRGSILVWTDIESGRCIALQLEPPRYLATKVTPTVFGLELSLLSFTAYSRTRSDPR
jgi:hypothetical protein